MREIQYHPRALKALARHRADATRLIAKIIAYAANPEAQANNIKRLKGMPSLYRLRVGDYRIIFTQTESRMVVIKVEPRGSAYD